MNSVSRVACIRAASVYEDRELNAVRSDEDTFVNRCVRTIDSKGDGEGGFERLGGAVMDGMVVDISVCTSTRVNIVAYTYGRTWSGREVDGSQSGAVAPL